MTNPLQTQEWAEKIIDAVLDWDKNHKEVLRMQSFNIDENRRNIAESKQKIIRRLRRIVVRVAREHLRNEKSIRPKDLKALFSVLEEQKKEIEHLAEALKSSKNKFPHISII